MKNKELKNKSKEEVLAQINELNKELIKLNTQVATGTTLKSPGIVRKTKKSIARLLTYLRSKEEKDE